MSKWLACSPVQIIVQPDELYYMYILCFTALSTSCSLETLIFMCSINLWGCVLKTQRNITDVNCPTFIYSIINSQFQSEYIHFYSLVLWWTALSCTGNMYGNVHTIHRYIVSFTIIEHIVINFIITNRWDLHYSISGTICNTCNNLCVANRQ